MFIFASPDVRHSSEVMMETLVNEDPGYLVGCEEYATLLLILVSPGGENALDEDELEDLINHLLECESCREQYDVAAEINDDQRAREERLAAQRALAINVPPSNN